MSGKVCLYRKLTDLINKERALFRINPQTLVHSIVDVDFHETLRPFLLIEMSSSKKICSHDEDGCVVFRRVANGELRISLQQGDQSCSDVVVGEDVWPDFTKIDE